MQGVAVLLIPFAVMAFALGMERLQTHLDSAAASESDTAVAPAAATAMLDAPAATLEAEVDTPGHGPAPGAAGHLRFAS
jgi:hypothetical protein